MWSHCRLFTVIKHCESDGAAVLDVYIYSVYRAQCQGTREFNLHKIHLNKTDTKTIITQVSGQAFEQITVTARHEKFVSKQVTVSLRTTWVFHPSCICSVDVRCVSLVRPMQTHLETDVRHDSWPTDC